MLCIMHHLDSNETPGEKKSRQEQRKDATSRLE